MTVPSYDPVNDAVAKKVIFTRNGKKRAEMEFREGPIEVFKDISSLDPRLVAFKKKLATYCSKHFPPAVDALGRVSGNGVRANFNGLRHISGYGQRPATWPIADNRRLREQAGLTNDTPTGYRRLVFEALYELFFTGLEPVPLKIRKGSSTMAPYYVTNMDAKIEMGEYYLKVGADACKSWVKGDYEAAWDKWRFGGYYDIVYRLQSSDAVSDDLVPKARRVADLEYALSGGSAGRMLDSSKSLDFLDLDYLDGMFAQRKRTAWGGPASINYVLAPVAQAVRKKLYSEYGETYHHTTRQSMEADLRKSKFTIAADVSQHDQFWPHWLLEIGAETLESVGYEEWFCHLYKTKSKLGMLVTGVGPNQPNLLIGDWRKPELQPGLPSGNSFTDIEGTILMTGVYFLLQAEHTAPDLLRTIKDRRSAMALMDRYLRWKLPFALKDKSDDALLCWLSSRYVFSAERLLKRMVEEDDLSKLSNLMTVGYEHGGAFLGSILLFPESKNPSGLTLVGNPLSYLINQFSPEYGVQSKVKDRSRTKRPYPGLAWGSYDEVFGSMPIYSDLKEVVEKVWFDCFGYSYSAFRAEMYRADEYRLAARLKEETQSSLVFSDLTSIEVEATLDPDKLFWKIDPSDVRPEIANMAFNGISLDVVEPFFESVFNN